MSGDAISGVELEPGHLGELNVMRNGVRIGWVHGDDRDGWRAYVPSPGGTSQGQPVGYAKAKNDAVRLIVAAAPQ